MYKSLKEYAGLLEENGLLTGASLKGAEDIRITDITYDSKKAGKGSLFICKGAAFKKEYLQAAIDANCVAYISEKDYNIPDIPFCVVKDIRDAMPLIAKMFYEIPEELKVIGLTGTKGKTTTAYYLKQVFDEAMHMQGRPEVAFLSTVETYDGKERISSGITTPESFEIYRHFRNACDSGIDNVIMEVSSQALKYKRTDGIVFDSAVFLNISEDHISPIEHPDFKDYFESKLKIFKQCRTAFVCTETDYFNEVVQAADSAERIITFGFGEKADVQGYNIVPKEGRTYFSVKFKNKAYDFVLNMRGEFNVENALAAIAVAFSYKLPYEAVKRALETVSVPGRWEEYESKDGKIHAVVDYAHNGLSFRNIISSAKSFWPGSRIVTVFGCPGGKALNRRRDLGSTAGELSDHVYLTADDPARERVEDICMEIGAYVEKYGCSYEMIPDRKKAVLKAFKDSTGDTVILVLGKGSETTQKTANGSESYESDAAVVISALETYNNSKRD